MVPSRLYFDEDANMVRSGNTDTTRVLHNLAACIDYL